MVPAVVLWLLVLIVVGYVVEWLCTKLFDGKGFHYLLAPGVIVHELSHVLGCFLVGAEVQKVNLFSEEGGSVEHGKPKLPIVGQVIISLAPIAGCLVVLWGISLLFKSPPDPKWALPGSVFPEKLWDGVVGVGMTFWTTVTNTEFRNLRTLAFGYFLFTFALATAPSKADLKNAIAGIVALGLLWALVLWFMRKSPLDGQLPTASMPLWGTLSMEVLALVVALAIAIPLVLVAVLVRRCLK